MLTFYPEFEAESPSEVEVIFLLDLSCSMKVHFSVFSSQALKGGKVGPREPQNVRCGAQSPNYFDA